MPPSMAPGSEPMPPSTAAVNAFTPASEADIEIDDAIIEKIHEPGDGRERGADDEGQGDRAVDVHAQQARHLHVLLAGALGAAERGLGNDVGEARHQAHGDDHDDDLNVGQLNGESATCSISL